MITCTDKIGVSLIGELAEDIDVVNAARISFDQVPEWPEPGATISARDEGLINYLMKNKHGTPFEHSFFRFKIEAPLFVFREWHRHRIGHSYNEMSGRYTELEPKFYLPKQSRLQEGKPGLYTFVEGSPPQTLIVQDALIESYELAWGNYQLMLKEGIAKEQARLSLPVAIFSKMIWSCNARSLLKFLELRTAMNAMYEIRMAALQVETLFAHHMPVTRGAFNNNGRIAP